MSAFASTKTEQIAVDSIVVGKRRRQKLGNIQALAQSIEKHGLVHPILIRNGNELVVGERRLQACIKLGWKTIPAQHIETLSDEDHRAIELEENVQRLALNDYESSLARLAQIRQAEAKLKAETEKTWPNAGQVSRPKGKRGPERNPGSRRDVAEATGISRQSQDRIETHVSLAEQFPFMQKNEWVQHQVLEAGTILEKIPESERENIAALLDQPAIPPKKSIEMLDNLAQMTPSARKEIYRLATSDIKHDRDIALTKACNVPPPPDPAINRVREARDALICAAKLCRTHQFSAPLEQARDQVISIEKEFTCYIRGKHE